MEISSDAKFVIGVLVATVLVIGGGAYLVSKKSVTSEGRLVPEALVSRLIQPDSPRLGDDDAKVTLVEFGDFQCPSCGSVYPLLKEIEEQYSDKSVQFVFRNFPLSQHENAFIAAEAGVEALEQGKFWEMHDTMFENQNRLTKDDLVNYARELNLDMPKFEKALNEHTHKDLVQRDISDGTALSVTATPTIFINNRQYTGSFSVQAISAALDKALSE